MGGTRETGTGPWASAPEAQWLALGERPPEDVGGSAPYLALAPTQGTAEPFRVWQAEEMGSWYQACKERCGRASSLPGAWQPRLLGLEQDSVQLGGPLETQWLPRATGPFCV